ncbi:MAG: hypothetical protein KatS3mg109_1251 [Pirellulaceae bacterium]|nr:MAG: hypothetical protein KatS3mg109_1251 [Pirellulaceae bacterium]
MSFHMRCGSELRRGTCAWMVLLLLAVAARAQVQETHIIGRVVDGAGNPIPGASVTLIIDDLFGASNREEVRRLGRQETDSEGKFQFRERYSVAARIWLIAWKANTGFGWTRVTPIGRAIGGLGPSSDSHTQEITLVAHKSLPVRLQIVDQEAKPITGGTVDLASVKEESLDDFPNITGSLPELRRTIDSSGFVTLDYLPPEVEALVLVDTPTFGRQSFQISRPDGTDTVTLRMQPLGKVTVTLSGDPEEIRRRRIEIFSARDPLTDPGARTPRSFARFSSGRAEAVTDEEGTATAMVAAGRVQVFVEVPPHAKSFAPRVREKALPPGGTLEISLTMRPRIRVQGMVVSEENAPISGVRIWTGGQLIQTDEQGKFEFLTSDEQVYATITYIPDGYAQPVRNYLDFSDVSTGERVQDPTAIVPAVTVPAVRLYKAAQVSGVVVDQTGTRVPGAAVHALWMLADENSSTRALKYANVRADENGEFTVPGIRKGVDVTLTAAASGMASLEPLSVHTGEPQKVRLEIHPHGVVQIEGRVKGSDGKPVPHPRIALMGERSVGELRFTQYRIRWDQGDYFSGDENGYFRTPTPVPRSATYQLDVSAPGYAVLRTEPRSATGSVLDFGEIILEKLRTVKGVVRDSSGQPVAKARLWAYASQASNVLTSAPRTECFTDSAGQFTLENLHPKAFYAIVEADGYRIQGFPIRAGEESAEVTLFRVDEAVPEQHRVRPIAWDTRQHEALVRKLLDGVVPEYTRSARFDTEAISILGRTDPMAALSMVESMQSPEMRARALALLGELDDALAEAENVTNAMRRAMTNLEILDHIKDHQAEAGAAGQDSVGRV